jgi:NAD(P)H-hydrate epimerase
MKEIDESATRRFGIPPLLLMEQAGRSVVEEIEHRYGALAGATVLIVAGKGNNGGDGFVAARHALHRGAMVTLLLAGNKEELHGDAKTNYDIVQNIDDERLSIVSSFATDGFAHQSFDFIVDAIFGTSFHGEAKGEFKTIIEWINAQVDSTIVAVDVPSGLEADTGECGPAGVKAELTVTMALPKIGFYVNRGPELSGSIAVADIHIPRRSAEGSSSRIFLIQEADVSRKLPLRPRNAHKHSVGKIFVLAGSKGLTGAALLSSMSAMKAGAGAVILGIPSAVFPAVSRRTLEVMPMELPSTGEGTVALSASKLIDQRVKWADVLLLGPGLSRNSETKELIGRTISSSTKTLVIDADGLNAMSENPHLLRDRKCNDAVLTPHLGEFSRLISLDAAKIEHDKIELARTFATENRVVLVLKGAPTMVASPLGDVFINSTGNPGMATAGSGDVLGGIIAALLGQGNSPLDAAINGVYIHGRAGDMARDEIGEMGMVASDIMRRVPLALKLAGAKKNGDEKRK